jgi:hypothetical protein
MSKVRSCSDLSGSLFFAPDEIHGPPPTGQEKDACNATDEQGLLQELLRGKSRLA